MDEIDAVGRQMLVERPLLTRGRLSVYRDTSCNDYWFPRLNVTLKRSRTDHVLWSWTSHDWPIDYDEPPPYDTDGVLEKYFELETPLKTPRGLEAVFHMTGSDKMSSYVDKFSAAIYLYPKSLEERGVEIAVLDFVNGFNGRSLPYFFRSSFPW
jgi:hypothetical protein